ncbi:hypothetical protein HY483_00480 [Candidatus Woesearchaeota archaeon]|nr:hypothetical protein [Candidatus Woesearchaeota archaeon]
MNNRGVADWVKNLVSLIITAIGLVILFMYVSAQFGVFFGSGREDDTAKAGLHSFAVDLDSAIKNGEKYYAKTIIITTEGYSTLFFPEGSGAAGTVGLEDFDSNPIISVDKPYTCGRRACVCVYSNVGFFEFLKTPGKLSTQKARTLKEHVLDCAPINADYVLTFTPTKNNMVGFGYRPIGSLEAIYDNPIKISDYPELAQYEEFVVEKPRWYTRGIYWGNVDGQSSGRVYVEKTVQDGKTFLLILPENKYSESRAELFREKFGDPVDVLNEKVDGGNDSKIISFADKKFSELFDIAKTAPASSNARVVAVDNLKNFSSVYLSFLLGRPSEKFSSDRNAPLFLEEASRIVGVLLDNFGVESFVKDESIKLFVKAQSTVVSGRRILESFDTPLIKGTVTSKISLYSSVIRTSTVMDPKTYTLLKNIVEQNSFWRTVLFQDDIAVPQRLFEKLRELSVKGSDSEKQKSFYLLGIAFKNYPFREDINYINLTKRFYNESIIALNNAISIDSANQIAQDSLLLKQELCSLVSEKIGVDGVGACE